MSTDDFFTAPPLSPQEARRLEAQRAARRRDEAYDETGSLSEDEERERADRVR